MGDHIAIADVCDDADRVVSESVSRQVKTITLLGQPECLSSRVESQDAFQATSIDGECDFTEVWDHAEGRAQCKFECEVRDRVLNGRCARRRDRRVNTRINYCHLEVLVQLDEILGVVAVEADHLEEVGAGSIHIVGLDNDQAALGGVLAVLGEEELVVVREVVLYDDDGRGPTVNSCRALKQVNRAPRDVLS